MKNHDWNRPSALPLRTKRSFGFERLEDRRMLATTTWDLNTATVNVAFDPGEMLVTVGNDGTHLTVNGVLVELPAGSASKHIEIGQIENLRVINGNIGGGDNFAKSFPDLVFSDTFNSLNAPLLNEISLSGIDELLFNGFLETGGTLTANLAGPSSLVGQASGSTLIVRGKTEINLPGGQVLLNEPANDFGVAMILEIGMPSGESRIRDANGLVLAKVDVDGSLHLQAPVIVDIAGATIDVGETLYLQGANIILGDSAMLSAARLNVQATGSANISMISDMILTGVNSAGTAILRSQGMIGDVDNVTIGIAGELLLDARAGISLGDSVSREFNAGTLFVSSGGNVQISENSDMVLSGVKVDSGNVMLVSTGNMTDIPEAIIDVRGDLGLSADSIALGNSPIDYFVVGRLQVQSGGAVLIYANGDLTMHGSNNAFDLTLHAGGGHLGNAAGTNTVAANQATLSGRSVTFGLEGSFNAQFLTLQSTGNVTVRETDSMLLVGNSSANTFRLSSHLEIRNANNARVVAKHRLDLAAMVVSMGNANGDYIESRSLRFTTLGAMNLSADSDILIVLNNQASTLSLSSPGVIFDQPGSSIAISGATVFTGTDVVIGNDPTECFVATPGNVIVNASGLASITYC